MLYVWPVPKWLPKYSYHQAPRKFGSDRDHKQRKHAGCDLYAPEGSPVVAVWHGRVDRVYEFYGKADAIEINHGALGVIRYGELIADDAIDSGTLVKPGQKIGTIARLQGLGNIHPMLHFEMYKNTVTGKLTQPGNAFRRRSDLVDPTNFLVWLRLTSAVF